MEKIEQNIQVTDEMDFIIACLLIEIFNGSNLNNENEMMYDAKEIFARFIEALEYVYTNCFKEKCGTKKDIYCIDISKLYIGMIVKNYKEMCRLLGQEIKNGKSKTLQVENWKRYFEWEKNGQKFIIIDIYNEPLPKNDLRSKGNNSIYKKYIEIILLQYLLKQPRYMKTFTKRNWLELLGMINQKYGKESNENLKQLDYCINNQEINLFYIRSNQKLQNVFFTALRNLEREKLILVEFQTVIVYTNDKGKEYHFLANDQQKKNILRIERYILSDVMGYKDMFHICFKNKKKEYYSRVNEKLNELYGWKYYYKQIKIIYDKDNIINAIPSKEIILQKEILNSKVIEFLNESAKKEYDRKEVEYNNAVDEILCDWIGDKEYLKNKVKVPNMWKYPDTYVEAQRILTDELIRIGHNDIPFVSDKLLTVAEEDNEFLTWMA